MIQSDKKLEEELKNFKPATEIIKEHKTLSSKSVNFNQTVNYFAFEQDVRTMMNDLIRPCLERQLEDR